MARLYYRITRPMLAFLKDDDAYVTRRLPQDTSIAFDPDVLPSAGTALVEVVWQSNVVLMSASGLRNVAVPE